MTTEYEYLKEADRVIIDALIAECMSTGQRISITQENGRELYAYKHPHGCAWGINSGRTGCNVARGVEERK